MTENPNALYDQVVDLAAKVMRSDEISLEEQLELINEYGTLFAELQKSSEEFKGYSQEQLEELNGLHARVIRKAQALQKKLTEDMKGLRTKGSALLKYLDVLPKRISSRRPRKG